MSGAEAIHELIAGQAERRPGAPAIITDAGEEHDYAGYAAAVREAAELLGGRGLGPGDRLLIVAENAFETAVLIFAASALGAVAVPVNARMTSGELARIEAHCAPRLVAYTCGASQEAQAHGDTAGAARLETGFGPLALAAPPSAQAPAAMVPGADVAVLLYTTGTTGDPKGVMLTHGNLLFAGAASARLRDLVPGDVIYGALPLTHVFGLASMLMASASSGAAVQLEARFTPERLLAALRAGVTVFPAVPQMHALLMKHTAELGMDRLDGAALRYVSSGAAPLDPAWKRKAEAFYGLPLQNGYGMTESTAGTCGTRNPIGTADTSVGRPLEGIEVRIDAPDAEGVGEIVTRGPHVMKGYYLNSAETARVLSADGWLRTGDLGRIDADGCLHVVGRCKELIIRSGFNVYPPEVEAAINAHPAVVQCAVVGRRVEGGNEEVLAFAQCTAPGAADEDMLKAFAAEHLSSYKRPSRILVVDRLPAAATGKILKHRLLGTFAAQLDASPKGD
ncbi:class I adenylate-forming enzyme family protein [Profundibacterium mesophilum]|uniref:Phenylacetate-CoA ligase n=1 Tax=Profundibacterium mesophilum KAUST100406-0324 TaxID=1037889 RepID=A0A921NQF3_9RHOB|nr:class I adenylate-forming enzyme family protein [Profundibacterium mesophilum]KAF0676881.1 phenylacetate-CoA ligase [Profundibacterium mesophilum KAUST100406-0324]